MRTSLIRAVGPMALLVAVAVAGCDDDSPTDPTPTPSDVQLDPDEVSLLVGETETLAATVLDEDGDELDDVSVSWSSSDESVATVDDDGVVEGVEEGTAEITAEAGSASATADVTVDSGE